MKGGRLTKMKTWLGLLMATSCCCAAMADDAVLTLSKHLGRTPALVVVVCEGTQRDLTTINQIARKVLAG